MARSDQWRSVKHVQELRRRKVMEQWDIKCNCKLTSILNYDRGLKIYDPRW